MHKKQNEIELMNIDKALHEEQDKKQFMFTKGVLVLAVLAMILLFVVYINERRTRKANKTLHSQKNELFEKNEEINQQKEEIQTLNDNLETNIKERTQELDSVVSELHQKNKGLSEFSYIVAHNIRAPVASIKGLLSLVDYSALSPDHLEILLHIQKTIENFETVVADLDEILEIRDTQQLKIETVYLKDITEHTLDKFKNEIRRNKAKIIVDFEDEPRLNTNKDYLSDILYHLLSNAIKYQSTNRPLEVFIGSMSEDDYIVVEVRDNGVGIDLSKTESTKIFGMHQRMHTHVEGKGFGLYLVKNMIEALHGKITVESEVDKGSCFKLYFLQSV